MQSIARLARVSCLGVALAFACDPLAAQSITPRFAWPANSVAEVSIRSSAITESNGRRDSTANAGQSRLEGRVHRLGTLIIAGPTTGLSIPNSQSAPDVKALTQLVSRFVVTADGMFARLEDVQATKRAMDSAMAPITANLRALRPSAAESIDGMTTPERLTENTVRSWQLISGMLFGKTWAPGDTTLRRFTQPLPGLPGAEVSTTTSTRYVGVATCPTASGAKLCWQFESTMDMDMKSLRAAMVQMMREMGVDDPTAAERMPVPRTTTHTTIIFDAATSRPLVSTARSTMDMSGTMAGNAVSNSVRSTSVTTYTWKP